MQKLELTWIGKNKEIKVEPRILLHDPSKDYGDKNTDNILIHGDNLLALKALESKYAGQVKCIYIDPPYNTGSAFEHYDDSLEHSIWLKLMRERLIILNNLLAPEGSIFIQIDDEEYAYLKVLMDEVFGRSNYINTVSVLMKNIAGASGGGEDKRLKKNIEYILIYAKKYDEIKPFKPAYKLTPISQVVQQYKNEGKSWKYTSVLLDPGEKTYITSTVDGEGNEIKIYRRDGLKSVSVSKYAKDLGISEGEAYERFYSKIYRTTMPQSSIRPRVMEKMKELNLEYPFISIEYVPRSGKNKGQVYEQFYSGSKYNLFAWLSDVVDVVDGVANKKDLQGTYWDFVGETKNLTKEGGVQFPNGKKAERLVARVLDMATNPGDLVLDSFLGSGTTAAVATKMNRKWIGIELGNHAYTHCKPRLDKVIDGADHNGITADVDWKGGSGYKFYELAPSLITKDQFGTQIIDPRYDSNMLAAAVALLNGYSYSPDKELYWKQGFSTERSFIFTTTNFITREILDSISDSVPDDINLLICTPAFEIGLNNAYPNITLKKIPQSVLDKCTFGNIDYSLPIIEESVFLDDEETIDD